MVLHAHIGEYVASSSIETVDVDGCKAPDRLLLILTTTGELQKGSSKRITKKSCNFIERTLKL
jgi:hypothetical protein